MLKKFKKLHKKLLLRRNVKFFRFPTLTRPLFDPPIFNTTFFNSETFFSDALLNRICESFQKANSLTSDDDIWTELIAGNDVFLKALRENDLETLRTLFGSLFHGPLLFGMGHTDLFLTKKSPYDPNYFSFRCRDSILSLAEAIGVKTLDSNQQTSFANYQLSTNGKLDNFIEKIEQKLGHSIEMPDVGKAPYADIGRYKISPDSVRHVYVIYRLKQIGISQSDSILEIGGGFGNVARYAYLQGLRDYTIVDLPYVNAIQAAYLAATIGEENISLFGENGTAAIKLHPSSNKESINNKFKIALNMDSLPEINQEEALNYLKLIQSQSELFLSINQEAKKTHKASISQYCVPELIAQLDGFKLLSRHPYWMEQGYAEELYSLFDRAS